MNTLSKTRHGINMMNKMKERITFHLARGRSSVDIATLEGWPVANVVRVMNEMKAETACDVSDKLPTLELGDDGYPTESTLKKITKWNVMKLGCLPLLRAIKPIWAYSEAGYFTENPPTKDGFTGTDEITFKLSTAGWSGNEDIISALEENTLFWAFCWYSSQRGGYHEFSVPTHLEKKP